jgi:hypothetical protein
VLGAGPAERLDRVGAGLGDDHLAAAVGESRRPRGGGGAIAEADVGAGLEDQQCLGRVGPGDHLQAGCALDGGEQRGAHGLIGCDDRDTERDVVPLR